MALQKQRLMLEITRSTRPSMIRRLRYIMTALTLSAVHVGSACVDANAVVGTYLIDIEARMILTIRPSIAVI
jgi:hypothetical protein